MQEKQKENFGFQRGKISPPLENDPGSFIYGIQNYCLEYQISDTVLYLK